jgi:hypothetical protein
LIRQSDGEARLTRKRHTRRRSSIKGKAAYGAFSRDKRFAMVGLSLDRDKAAPRAYAEKNGGITKDLRGDGVKEAGAKAMAAGASEPIASEDRQPVGLDQPGPRGGGAPTVSGSS